MALISKPDYTYIWASGGAVVEPSNTKKQTGWVAEVPPFQWENWAQNRQDQMLAHINQRGIAAWSGDTEYEAGGLSYVQGSNGTIYKSVAASGPSTTTQDPTTDVSDTYWTVAFADVGAFLTETAGDVRYLQKSLNGGDIPNTTTFRANIGVVSADAATAYAPGYFHGFQLANDVTNPNTTISVGAGAARDYLDSVNIRMTSALRGILQASGAWAAGDNQNKLLIGARANNTWYHVFSIRKTSDGSADIALHPSIDPSADMPSGYAGFVLIESILTDGSGNILQFVNVGRTMTWKSARQDVALFSVAAGNSTVTISTPPGRRVKAIQYAAAGAEGTTIYTHSPDVNNETLGFPGGGWKVGITTNNPAATGDQIGGFLSCITGVSSNIVLQTFTAAGDMNVVQLATVGWEKV